MTLRERLSPWLARLHRLSPGGGILQGGFWMLSAYGIRVACALGLFWLLARFHGPAVLGAYAMLQAALLLVVYLGFPGLNMAFLKYVPAFEAGNHPSLVRSLYWKLTRFGLTWTLILAGAAALLAEPLAGAVLQGGVPAGWFRWLPAAALSMGWLQINGGLLRARRRTAAYAAMQIMPAGMTFLVLIVLTFGAEGADRPLWALLLGHGCAWLVSQALAGPFLFSRRPAGAAPQTAPPRWRELWSLAWPIFLLTGAQLFLNSLEILLVGAWRSDVDAGLMAVAGRLVQPAVYIFLAVNAGLVPRLAELHHHGDRAGMEATALRSAAWVFGSTLPVTAGLWLLGAPALALFGPAYPPAYPAVALLALAQLVTAAAGNQAQLLILLGHSRAAGGIILASLALTLGLDALWIPRAGATGAAAAHLIGLVLRQAALALVLRRHGLSVCYLPGRLRGTSGPAV